jgi:hypothetical protein
MKLCCCLLGYSDKLFRLAFEIQLAAGGMPKRHLQVSGNFCVKLFGLSLAAKG